MQNFCGEYLQGIERTGCGILLGSILTLSKTWDADAIIHARQAEKHLQVQRNVSCRYNSCICNSKYQGLVDTTITTKISTTLNKRDV